jgi:FkbM family methyltransferase
MYSQYNEESVLINYFNSQNKQSGRFLDIGAFDGETFSNTRKLAEMGWSGILFEPSPDPFQKLYKLYKDNRNIVVVNAAISKQRGNIVFYDSAGDAISTTSLAHKALWENGTVGKYKEITVSSVTPGGVLTDYGSVYDFVNIDTEGTNFEILIDFVAAGLRFEVLCIEHDNKSAQIVDMFPYCVPLDYNGVNLIISHKKW